MPSIRSRPLTLLLAAVLACSSTGNDGATSVLGPEDQAAMELVRAAAIPVTGAPTDYDSLMALVGDARFVLLGEATHGTQEFYHERARITQRLIQEKGFTPLRR